MMMMMMMKRGLFDEEGPWEQARCDNHSISMENIIGVLRKIDKMLPFKGFVYDCKSEGGDDK